MSEAVNLVKRGETYKENVKDIKKRIVVCAGTGCIAGGALKVIDKFEEVIKARGLNVAMTINKHEDGYQVSGSGCQGFCRWVRFSPFCPKTLCTAKSRPKTWKKFSKRPFWAIRSSTVWCIPINPIKNPIPKRLKCRSTASRAP